MQDMIRTQAIEWHIRLRHGDDADWEMFEHWLAADPHHGEAYDAIERADLAIEPLLAEVVFREAANDGDEPEYHPLPARRGRWLFAGGALAASVALAFVLFPWLNAERYEVTTPPGAHRIVALDATTRVTLNGSTRMLFDRKDPRFAALITGEALFHIRHDAAQPFRLEVGEDVVEDAGTVFNVIRTPASVRVAVAEGRVVYNPDRQAVTLEAGEALAARESTDTIRVEPTAANSVGAWQRGQLVYAGEPLPQVAADLSRSLGVRIVVSPDLANRPFHGTIALDGTGPRQLARLQHALGVTIEAGPAGWIMKSLGGGGR